MSIGTSHIFNPLTKDSKPLDGQRLVRLIAKGENKPEHLQSSVCVSIPVLTQDEVVEHIDSLVPHIVGWLQGVQDKVIREYRVTSGAADMHEDLFNVVHCIEWLTANGEGIRLTREYLTEWFMRDYGEVATQWIENRFTQLGKSGVNGDVIRSKVKVLCDVIAGWASGGKYKPSLPQCRMMVAFAGDVENDGIMEMVAKNSQARIDAIENENSMDALGF